MEQSFLSALALPHHHHHHPMEDVKNIVKDFGIRLARYDQRENLSTNIQFAAISLNPLLPSASERQESGPHKWLKPAVRGNQTIKSMMKSISTAEKAVIGAVAGSIAGAFTYFCLHPLDTVKTKLQTRGASEIYSGSLDVIAKVLKSQGVLGFYSGISAVIVGSAASSAIYFGTCEFGKSVLSTFLYFPAILIPPAAGAMGNIVSSAIMVPKELITQRMQAGEAGRSWEVFLKIIRNDGILGLYTGYSATLFRNLPAGVLSYSSFEYLKSAVVSRTGKDHLEPIQSVVCGALAGAVSATLTTPLDVVKTRLMTQVVTSGGVVDAEAKARIAISVYTGISSTIRQIVKDEGWVSLTRGMGPRVLHSACFAALGYFAFETARLFLLHHYVQRKNKITLANEQPVSV
ncbi:unnamed protein product [Victoria cruziana]